MEEVQESKDNEEQNITNVSKYRFDLTYVLFDFDQKALGESKYLVRSKYLTELIVTDGSEATKLNITITPLIVQVTEDAITYNMGGTQSKTFDTGTFEEKIEEFNQQIESWNYFESYVFKFDYNRTGNLDSFIFVTIEPSMILEMFNSPLTTWSEQETWLRII